MTTKINRRFPAEWENQSAILITFPHKNPDWGNYLPEVIQTFVTIIEAITKFQHCIVICNNQLEVETYLKNCPEEKLTFFEIPSNDVWARDHGGISILENEKWVLLDFIFNGWGGKFPADKDNLITKRLSEIFSKTDLDGKYFPNTPFLKYPKIRAMNFVLEGGSIESDGNGTLLSTSKCLLNPNRNPQFSKEEIEGKLIDWFGLKQILWLNHGELIGDDTDAHIDTLARFCDKNTIAYIQCLDEDDPQFSELKLMEAELTSFRTLKGEPYNLIPLPLPNPIYDDENNILPAMYANFLIINEAILLPIYQVAEDEIAIKQLEKAFPNREVIGINCCALIRQGGSLHCATMQFPEV